MSQTVHFSIDNIKRMSLEHTFSFGFLLQVLMDMHKLI